MEGIEVRASAINGQGVFATRRIAKGTVILAIDDSVVIGPDDPGADELLAADPDYCDYLPDGTVILMQAPERHINHSCTPNVYIYTAARDRFVLAMRGIAQGEELVFDYAIGLVNGDLLQCHCGSYGCRGTHRSDFFELPGEKQLEYLPYLDCAFVTRHQEKIQDLLRRRLPSGSHRE